MAFLQSLGRTVGIAVFTLVETVTLGIWLAFVRDVPTFSTMALIGAGILFVGLVIEALVNTVVVTGFGDFPLGVIATFSLTEALIWIAWLLIAGEVGGLTGVGIAGVVLFVLMLPQHSIEDNTLRGRPLFSNVLELGTAIFTFVEAIGGTVWLALVFHGEDILAEFGLQPIPTLPEAFPEFGASLGLILLGVLLFVEHGMGVQFALRMGEPGTGV